MKFGFYPESIVDTDGKPLVGRVTLFVHDTDTKLDVFTIEGENYVPCENPLLLNNAGRLNVALFFEAAIVDVRIDRYVGAEGQMSATSPDRDFRPFDIFEYGFDPSDIVSVEFVDTIAELMNTPTTSKYITVMGYYGAGDCMPRTYYWDSEAEDVVDGGYVVGSNLTESGRWILLWNSEQLPCSVYGIIAGVNESNMNAFLSYPAFVGSVRLKTSPIARFERGEYSTDVNLASEKTVAFDTGAKFPSADLYIKRAVVNGSNSDFIADMFFSDTSCEAHSSWFRSIESFLTCGANTLVVDNTDNFLNKNLSLPTNVSNATIVFSSNTRLPITYTNTGRLGLSRVNLVGSAMFDNTDKIAFSYMAIRDEWWQNPTSVDWVNKVAARSTSNNVLLLSNFKYVNAYIDAVKANGDTSLDLSGRYVSSFTDTSFTDLRNISCGRLEINMSGQDVYLHNVKSDNCEVLCHFLVCDNNCDIRFAEAEPVVNAAWFTDSSIHGSTTWFQNTYYEFKRCAVSVTFRRVSNNEDNENGLFFEDCQLLENRVIESKALSMKHCTTLNNTIRIYPYYDSENSFYRMAVTLEGNVFSNNTPIEFTRVETDGSENCTDIRVNWYIVGNTFAGNSEGLRCRYWQKRLGNNPNSVFIYRGDYNESSVTYKGNNGLCPSSSGVGLHCNDLAISEWYIHTVGDNKYSYFIANWGYKRIMPNVKDAGFGYSLLYLGTKSVDDDEYAIKTFDGADLHIERANLYMYPKSSRDNDSNGDFFLHAPCMIGEVTQAAPNDVHQWRYLT